MHGNALRALAHTQKTVVHPSWHSKKTDTPFRDDVSQSGDNLWDPQTPWALVRVSLLFLGNCYINNQMLNL